MEEVFPRHTSLVPLSFPHFVLCLIGVEAEGLFKLDYRGRAGILSIVRWNLRPVIFGVEVFTLFGGFRLVFDSFSIFLGPSAERVQEPLFRFFLEFSREGSF